MGMNGATLWHAVPGGCSHNLCKHIINTNNNSSGLNSTGTLTTSKFYTSSSNYIVNELLL